MCVKTPLADVVHHADHLLPGTVVAALREHLAEGVAIRPEIARHALVDHGRDRPWRWSRRDGSRAKGQVGGRRFGELLVALVERQHTLDVGGRRTSRPFEQPHSHGAEIFGRHGVVFDQQVAHLGRLPAQLDIVIAAAFERQVMADGGGIHAGNPRGFLQQSLREIELLRRSLVLRFRQTNSRP